MQISDLTQKISGTVPVLLPPMVSSFPHEATVEVSVETSRAVDHGDRMSGIPFRRDGYSLITISLDIATTADVARLFAEFIREGFL